MSFKIASSSLLVGGIGMMNIMLVSVTERTREIRIRMAVGAQQRDILLRFLVEALMICVMGGLVGWGVIRRFVSLWTGSSLGHGSRSNTKLHSVGVCILGCSGSVFLGSIRRGERQV